MPKKDGIQATREIKAELPDTEVVVLSAFHDDEQVLEALEAGARAYLVKDDDPASMLRAVHTASAGRLYLGPSLAKRVLQRMAAAPAPMQNGHRERRSEGRSDLTARETRVLRLLAEGKKAREIASLLEISERTVRNHLRNIFAKLRLSDRTQAIIYAVKTGLVKV
jgi:DNA-binding NarL/FixJ family response regulator